MEQEEVYFNQLRKAVESIMGREMKENCDFMQLREEIDKRTHFLLSATTLKRFWGYIEGEPARGMRTTTLDIIARFCNYVNYADFCSRCVPGDVISSDPCIRRMVYANELRKGQKMVLLWVPGRRVTVRHDGGGRFTILESIGSKLKAGDTFLCDRFQEGAPLVLECLEGPDHEAVNYCCAKGQGGLTLEL